MDIKNILEQFDQTMCVWITQLNRYNYQQLCLQPNAKSWSLGQVYEHLIADTEYYFQQIYHCLSTNENAQEDMADMAKEWFQNNSFPKVKLVGPPGNEAPPNPLNMHKLMNDLKKLKILMNKIGMEILKSPNKGKTKHPGFLYFNAAEWFQFAEMHFRHHLQQKERIDAFLKLESL